MTLPVWMQSELLDSNLRYRTAHHPPAFSAMGVAQAERLPPERLAKVVVALADGHPVLLVLPADCHVDLSAARAALRVSDLRLADEREMHELFPDSAVGAVPPLPHWPGVRIWVDVSLLCEGEIWFQAGTHEDAVALDCEAWRRWAMPRVADFARPMEGRNA